MEFPTDIQNKIKSFLIGWNIKAGDRFEMYKLGIGEIIILDVKTAYNIITIQGYKYFYSRSHNECKDKYYFEIKTEEPKKYKDFKYEDPYINLSRNFLITNNRFMPKIGDRFKLKCGGNIKIIKLNYETDNYIRVTFMRSMRVYLHYCNEYYHSKFEFDRFIRVYKNKDFTHDEQDMEMLKYNLIM